MMKRVIKYLSIVAIVGLIAYAGVQPNVGLTWTSATDPTSGAGVSAPMWQFLIRTDTNQFYYKSGASNTAWTPIGGGGTSGVTGTFTTNTIPKGTGSHSLGNSNVKDDGTQVTLDPAGAGVATSKNALFIDPSTTFTPTGGNLQSVAINATNNSSKSGGDSSLVGIGVYATSTAATTNWAAWLDGDVGITSTATIKPFTGAALNMSANGGTVHVLTSNIFELDGNSILSLNGSVGTTGQVLQSTGVSTQGWALVGNANLATAPALTVKGNATSGIAALTDIPASTAGGVFGRTGGNALAFSIPNEGYFGTGFDGNCAFDGVTTPVAGASLVGSTYTLTRDIMCASATVATGVEIKTASFRIMVDGVLTMTGTAKIDANGGNGGSPTAGTLGATAGYCTAPTAAGAGGTGAANGTTGGVAGAIAMQPMASDATGTGAPQNTSGSYTHAGGGGGQSVSNSGGLGGSTNKLPANKGAADINAIWNCQTNNNTTAQFGSGTGGGGGAASGGTTGTGGGGGGGGGWVTIAAQTIAGNGTCAFQSQGGNGGNGVQGNGSSAGGGGGGGGGVVALYYLTATGGTVGGCATSTAGGTHGTAAGTGTNGGDGHAGIPPAQTRFNFSGDGT